MEVFCVFNKISFYLFVINLLPGEIVHLTPRRSLFQFDTVNNSKKRKKIIKNGKQYSFAFIRDSNESFKINLRK